MLDSVLDLGLGEIRETGAFGRSSEDICKEYISLTGFGRQRRAAHSKKQSVAGPLLSFPFPRSYIGQVSCNKYISALSGGAKATRSCYTAHLFRPSSLARDQGAKLPRGQHPQRKNRAWRDRYSFFLLIICNTGRLRARNISPLCPKPEKSDVRAVYCPFFVPAHERSVS